MLRTNSVAMLLERDEIERRKTFHNAFLLSSSRDKAKKKAKQPQGHENRRRRGRQRQGIGMNAMHMRWGQN